MRRTLRRNSGTGRDEGFSLVELLVVVIIIGLLAAIAVPTLLSQRRRAVDASLKSDLRTVATAIEAARTNDGALPTTRAEVIADAAMSSGNTIDVTITGEHFCLLGDRATGSGPSHPWVYDSALSGLQQDATATCSGAVTFSLP